MTTPLSTPPLPTTNLRRVAILFSGGPAPAANAVIAAAASCFSRNGIEVLGIRKGYSNLMAYKPGETLAEGPVYTMLDARKLEGARTTQGILIGTARANPGRSSKRRPTCTTRRLTAPLMTVYQRSARWAWMRRFPSAATTR